MTSFDQLLEQIVPATTTVPLCMRGDLLAGIATLQDSIAAEAVIDEIENRPPVAPGLVEDLDALRAEASAASIDFVFQSVGKRRWTDLKEAHPPRQIDIEHGLDFNADTFPAAAIAESLVAPTGVTPEKLAVFEEQASSGQWARLWSACVDVNVGVSDIPKFDPATAVLRRFERSSTTAPDGASPAPSS